MGAIKSPTGRKWHWIQKRGHKVRGKTLFESCKKFYLSKWETMEDFDVDCGKIKKKGEEKGEMCKRCLLKYFPPKWRMGNGKWKRTV